MNSPIKVPLFAKEIVKTRMTVKVVFIVNGTESAQGTNPMANRGPVGRDRENTGRRILGTVLHTEMYRNNGPW